MPPLVIRVDADDRIGMGHLVRCLALAHAWGPDVTVATDAGSPGIRARIAAAGAAVARVDAAWGTEEDAARTAAIAAERGAGWVVVDGYHFDVRFQRALRHAGRRVLCIDDNGEAGEYACAIVLNQNLHARESLYANRDADTQLLLGPEYVLLRPEFSTRERALPEVPSLARRVLVTLGGGDAGAALGTILEALAATTIEALHVKVITGALKDPAALESTARGIAGRVDILTHADDMPALMSWADLAVSGGGSTSWELAYMGVPTLAIVMATNQMGAVGALVEQGIVVPLGARDALAAALVAGEIERIARDAASRRRMSAAGRALIDGRGATRVVQAMRSR